MRKYLFMALGLTVILGSCRNFGGKRVRGNGNMKTEEHSVSNFKNVEVSGAMNVYVSQGAEGQHSVKIEGDENLLQFIEMTQDGDKIIVRTRHGFNLEPTKEIRVYVSTAVYNSIDVSGACNIIGEEKINNPEDLKLRVSGAGDIKMEVDAPSVKAGVSGGGSINLRGQTKDVELDLTGAGDAHCYELLSENTRVDISGAGSAEVYASVKLDATVSGAGEVSYKGNAGSVSQHVSGAGSVNKVN
ncbi:MAG TPA: head GIN domain-containing protein [Puia sp.]|nr:head GIN domain-containing protein [Puia sp.]